MSPEGAGWTREHPGNGLLPQAAPGPAHDSGSHPTAGSVSEPAPELAKVTPKRRLFLGGSREGRASAPTQHIFLSVNSDV